ncbi:hypothetical protein PanWU01x14_255330 [Parasponia andersonii]|uniref:Uncharacterized protein n=1 Tax=Parasponia andersonii TaxID=3476 RepID=A0A2P5BAZ1_PARAD|nr:hypothetical protein PanWU01x14_255330 [Parasponia andersonii]
MNLEDLKALKVLERLINRRWQRINQIFSVFLRSEGFGPKRHVVLNCLANQSIKLTNISAETETSQLCTVSPTVRGWRKTKKEPRIFFVWNPEIK